MFLIISFNFVDPVIASVEESFLRKMESSVDSLKLQKSLLEVATPLSDLGKDVVDQIHRRMDNDGDENDGDDYFMDSTYDFQDYALKYATCQKIQRFSTEAVTNGEYSAMIVDDIVVLRLCPLRYCSSSSQWGCNNGYGEYAIKLDEYLKIMLRYKADKRNNLCTFCKACENRRKMEDSAEAQQANAYGAGNDDGNANNGGNDDAAEQVVDDFYAYGNDDDNEADVGDDLYQANGDDAADQNSGDDNAGGNSGGNYFQDLCDKNSYLCENVYDKCNNGDDGMSYMDYMEYMGCTGLKNQNNGNYYWLSPHCDSSTNKITMGIFSDPYCSQYAGNSVNINNYAGVNFDNNIFQEFYKEECIDCSVSYSGPYYNSKNLMCNNIFQRSGQCNTYLAYSVSDGNDQATSEVNCAFIESIRYGTYDSNGQIYISGYSSDKGSYQQTVTPFQTGALVLLSSVCFFLAMYSCVLHHEITNTLLKSFNIGLISPGKVKSRSKSGSIRSKRRNRKELNDSEADYPDNGKVGEML